SWSISFFLLDPRLLLPPPPSQQQHSRLALASVPSSSLQNSVLPLIAASIACALSSLTRCTLSVCVSSSLLLSRGSIHPSMPSLAAAWPPPSLRGTHAASAMCARLFCECAEKADRMDIL